MAEPRCVPFVVTDFKGMWPVGTAALVYARDREHCKRVLQEQLREQGLGKDDPDDWTVEPVDVAPLRPSAWVILNGDY